MPRTVDEGFRDFLPSLTPTTGESVAAAAHRASIEECLKSNFSMLRFFRIGSFGNGTSIAGFSDVDYFAVIPRDKLRQDSAISLTSVRDVLDRRFPNTGVRVDCPAIRIPFGTDAKESTDVVPAFDVEQNSDGYLVYGIPDCAGSWMRASPDAHNAYVRAIDSKLAFKAKPVIRFIKAWKYYQNVPVSSFYLELRVAKYLDGEKTVMYDIDVKQIFWLLNSIGFAQMQDPAGISGYINAASTQAKIEDAKSKVSTALARATNALAAKDQGDVKAAFYWWNLLFAERFPSYYK